MFPYLALWTPACNLALLTSDCPWRAQEWASANGVALPVRDQRANTTSYYRFEEEVPTNILQVGCAFSSCINSAVVLAEMLCIASPRSVGMQRQQHRFALLWQSYTSKIICGQEDWALHASSNGSVYNHPCRKGHKSLLPLNRGTTRSCGRWRSRGTASSPRQQTRRSGCGTSSRAAASACWRTTRAPCCRSPALTASSFPAPTTTASR